MALAPVRVGRATVRVMETETALAMARAAAHHAKALGAMARTAPRATLATRVTLAFPAMPDSRVTTTALWPTKTSPRARMMRVRTGTAIR